MLCNIILYMTRYVYKTGTRCIRRLPEQLGWSSSFWMTRLFVPSRKHYHEKAARGVLIPSLLKLRFNGEIALGMSYVLCACFTCIIHKRGVMVKPWAINIFWGRKDVKVHANESGCNAVATTYTALSPSADTFFSTPFTFPPFTSTLLFCV